MKRKFGCSDITYVEETREASGENGDPDYISHCCDESLLRLSTDHIDLYQFHLGGYPLEKAPEVLAVFGELVVAGKARTIGWNTDDPTRVSGDQMKQIDEVLGH